MKNEKELFDLFVATDVTRPSLHHPFLQEGKVCASDGRVLIRIAEGLCEGGYFEYPYGKMPPRVSKVIPSATCNESLTMQMLQDAWAKMPAAERERMCKECDGSGAVSWMYMDMDGGAHSMEGECPVCHGKGVVSRYKTLACVFTIHRMMFSYGSIEVLMEVMKLLEVDELKLRYCPESVRGGHVSLLFGVEGKDIDIVVAPQVGETDLEQIKII